MLRIRDVTFGLEDRPDPVSTKRRGKIARLIFFVAINFSKFWIFKQVRTQKNSWVKWVLTTNLTQKIVIKCCRKSCQLKVNFYFSFQHCCGHKFHKILNFKQVQKIVESTGKIFNPKNYYKALRKYGLDSGSGIRDPENFTRIRIQGLKIAPDPGSGSATRTRCRSMFRILIH